MKGWGGGGYIEVRGDERGSRGQGEEWEGEDHGEVSGGGGQRESFFLGGWGEVRERGWREVRVRERVWGQGNSWRDVEVRERSRGQG